MPYSYHSEIALQAYWWMKACCLALESMVVHLILNVIIITAVTSAVTSVALMWYLQGRDNRKLTVELNLGCESDQHNQKTPLTQTPSMMDHSEDSLEEPVSAPGARLVPLPLIGQDIRQYVAQRASSWAALSFSGKDSAGQVRPL